jgi:phospholipase C
MQARRWAVAVSLWSALGCSSRDPSGAATTSAADAATDAGPSADAVDPGPVEDPGPPAPASWDRPVTPPSDAEASSKRASCGYASGALPAETLGASRPVGASIPIDTIVIVMQENRSFDHYYSQLRANGHPDAEVAPSTFTNPNIDGTPFAPYRDDKLCFLDTAHSWNSAHTEWNNGALDGFIRANESTGPVPPHGDPSMLHGTRAMSYYGPEELPFMYWAADQYAIGDHYHCSVLTSTWTNRMYLYAANSFGRISNSPPDTKGALTIFDELQMRRVSWKIYAAGTPPEAMFLSQYLNYKDFHSTSADDFFTDAAAGTLPHVVFLDGSDGDGSGFDPTQTDEHPPSNMQVGQAFVARATAALMRSPQWGKSVLFLTYDEHGGLWDHVPPPAACPPDSTPPELGPTDAPGGYDRLGIRVPFVAISPWVKKGFIGHGTYDHTSITRFVEARFTLPAMSARDANADVPYELFDFSHARTDLPTVPTVTVDPAVQARCSATLK